MFKVEKMALHGSYIRGLKNFISKHLFSKKHLRLTQTANYCDLTKNEEIQTISDVKKKFMNVMGGDSVFRTVKQSRSHLLKYIPASQEDMPTRSVKETFQSALIPLSTNLKLQEKYMSVLGNVRAGRLMEDMDIFSAWLAMNYIKNPLQPTDVHSPYIIVTVMVDQVSFCDFTPKVDTDIRISGHVSGVSKSTLETTVWLEQEHAGQWQRLASAIFLMAARNSDLTSKAPVNKLVPADDEEKLIISEAEARKRRRKIEVTESVLSTVPNADEQNVIHKVFLSSVDMQNPTAGRRVLPAGALWMSDTKRSNNVFSHPEDRNLHNKVFGGFLMRHALEISWLVTYFHSKHRPKLLHISDISFKHSVDVGSLLEMTAEIIYTEGSYMQVIVYAEVTNPFSGHQVTTNVFYFTYEAPEYVKPVIPNSYHEAMMYIDGQRHFREAMGL